jgi:nucleoside-diphosphate-sugar epimerase
VGTKAIDRILVTGALGQIGSELTTELRRRYGDSNVIASDLKPGPDGELGQAGPFEQVDVTDPSGLTEICRRHDIDTIVHLAAILSATGEKDPLMAWHVNITGLINALEIARDLELTQVLCPSSIAVFGAGCPKENTPQETVLKPSTMYGVTKVAGELLCDYYVGRYGVDARGLRYPGIVSAETLPGGGTTDYAVEIYYAAVEKGEYTVHDRSDGGRSRPPSPPRRFQRRVDELLGRRARRVDQGAHSGLPCDLPPRLPTGDRRLLAVFH